MKTTIDQALTKVFQQPARRPIAEKPEQKEGPKSDSSPPSSDVDRPCELYIDRPHTMLRPSRPEALCGTPQLEPPKAVDAERVPSTDTPEQSPEGAEAQTPAVVSTIADLTGMVRLWENTLTYETLVNAPPAEELMPLATDEASHAGSDLPSRAGSEPRPEVAPDSSVEASAVPSNESNAPQPAAAFHPAWEVDSLGLPPVCREIVSQVAEELTDLCQFLTPAVGESRNLVSIDSCVRGEGRTTVALALAHALAQLGQRVLLIDADFHHPNLATQLGLAVSQGWENAVRENLPVHECCIHSIGDGFAVLPLGRDGLELHDLATLQRIQELLFTLTEHFDRVVLDNGPAGESWVSLPPQRLLAHVVVRNLPKTSNDQLQRLVNRIQYRPEVLMSLVDNFAAPSALATARSA